MAEAAPATGGPPAAGGTAQTAPASASNMYKHASLTGLGGPLFERNQEATVYVGNLEPRVNEEIIWELFLQAGPIVNVHIPRDKVTNEHQSYGFVEFKAEEDADYSIKILHMVKLFNKPIKVNKASQDKRTQEVGAKVFVGNLSENVDERLLREVFSQFGIVLSSEVKRDPETGRSRHYGFVSFDNFDSSDRARENMNGQYLQGARIDVDYAYKKDNQKEKHGSVSERVLAFCQAQRASQNSAKLAKMFQNEMPPHGEAAKSNPDSRHQPSHEGREGQQNRAGGPPQGMPSLPQRTAYQQNGLNWQQQQQQQQNGYNQGYGGASGQAYGSGQGYGGNQSNGQYSQSQSAQYGGYGGGQGYQGYNQNQQQAYYGGAGNGGGYQQQQQYQQPVYPPQQQKAYGNQGYAGQPGRRVPPPPPSMPPPAQNNKQ